MSSQISVSTPGMMAAIATLWPPDGDGAPRLLSSSSLPRKAAEMKSGALIIPANLLACPLRFIWKDTEVESTSTFSFNDNDF